MTERFKKSEQRVAEAGEDIGTARLIAQARKQIAAGGPLIPKAIVDRIAKGESALRVLSQWRDVPQFYLSFKTGIGQGYLSGLENGRRKGTVKAWKKIARVLDVPLDLLV